MTGAEIIDRVQEKAREVYTERMKRLVRVEVGQAAWDALVEHCEAQARYTPPPSRAYVELANGRRIYGPHAMDPPKPYFTNIRIATDAGEVPVSVDPNLGDAISFTTAA